MGRGPEVNKFEQVFSDGHQMSIVGGSMSSEVPCPEGGHDWGGGFLVEWCPKSEGVGAGPRDLHSEVQCIMGNCQVRPPGHNWKKSPTRNVIDGR